MSKNTATLALTAPRNAKSETKAVVAIVPSSNCQPLSEEDIRLRAYRKWEAAGKPEGDGVQFWLEAEQDLSQAE